MERYPVRGVLKEAIERLFDEPSAACSVLGLDGEALESRHDLSVPAAKRVALLRAKLEEHIAQMADEHEEMGSPSATDTLRMQAIGLLIALRELAAHFPELREFR